MRAPPRASINDASRPGWNKRRGREGEIMATKTPKSSTVKSKSAATTTTAPKVSRVRKVDTATETSGQVMRELVAVRAYERFIERGYQHGHDVEDWLAAERDLTQPQ
ncbi:MAG TPA: DUF2934 domain-containing protein [Polyangia bacterium]